MWQKVKHKLQGFKGVRLQVAGILVLVFLAALHLGFHHANSSQAVGAVAAQVRFVGEYRIGDGPWQKIQEGVHIPATKGDVTLRGNFHMFSPDGEYIGLFSSETPLAFYTDHINLTFCEAGEEPYVIDHENPIFGAAACGADWTAHLFSGDSTEPLEILVHNPHRFGNETAIDEMLSQIALWAGMGFEREIMEEGQGQYNMSILLLVVSFVLLGAALFSTLLHIPKSRIIWLLGISIFSAGIYLMYSAPGIAFWNETVVVNTSMLGFSLMFYMLFVSGTITYFLRKTKKIGHMTAIVLGVINGVYFLLPMLTGISFYDTWLPWVITQSAANTVLICCMLREYPSADRKKRLTYIDMTVLLLAFETDAIATALGYWKGAVVSKYVFLILFAAAIFVVLRLIPENINAAEKAKELELHRSHLEAELKESRISILLSQIQPHFIYNTLGTIERMCLKEPEKAFELVRNFSLYLRGNFSEIDSVVPIRFADELKHVEYYVNIEKVRFPDMCIEYEVEATDFVLPALSVQPLVENAIKHGLMRLESGSTVWIRAYETPSHFCVEVKDNGVGFDTGAPIDGKKHIGLRNIRGRLEAMVNGELILESKEGEGTKVSIRIPKEVSV